MNKQQLNDYLHTSEGNVDIHIPNEIFIDFKNESNFKSWKHKSFAYAYYFLSTYIYRNTLYGITNPESFSQKSIVNVLVKNHTNISYIIKRNGLLEKMKYLKTTRNYPTAFYVDNDILEFTMIDDWDDSMKDLKPKVSTSFFIKEPLKAFNRYDEDFSGTFYSVYDTHKISIHRFISIITNPKLGCLGLYIYAFLSMMNGKFKDGYQTTNDTIAEIVGCSNGRTIGKYMKELELLGYISSSRNLYEYKLLGKIYIVNE